MQPSNTVSHTVRAADTALGSAVVGGYDFGELEMRPAPSETPLPAQLSLGHSRTATPLTGEARGNAPSHHSDSSSRPRGPRSPRLPVPQRTSQPRSPAVLVSQGALSLPAGQPHGGCDSAPAHGETNNGQERQGGTKATCPSTMRRVGWLYGALFVTTGVLVVIVGSVPTSAMGQQLMPFRSVLYAGHLVCWMTFCVGPRRA